MNLKALINKYGSHFHGGSSDSVAVDRGDFRGELATVRTSAAMTYWLIVGLNVVVFLVACVLVFRYSSHPDTLKGILAGTGLSLSGTIAVLIKVGKEKTLTDMLLLLARDGDSKNIQYVIDALRAGL
ncbi:MAG: hypothetical protein EOP84_02320 [Verrucomicrobiaceae bacterium]|nr:MAG: hypothetical protein EOP84_02320 [Verrucomicrobiaceae bacterium]